MIPRRIVLISCIGIVAGLSLWWRFARPQDSTSAATERILLEKVSRSAQPPSPVEPPRKVTLAAMLKETNPILQAAAVAEHLLALPSGEFATEFKVLLAQPPSVRRQELLRYLLRQWGRIDPAGALPVIAASSNLFVNDRAKYTDLVLEGWVTQQPAEAWAWALRSLPELPAKNAAFGLSPATSVAEQRAGGSGENRMKSLVAALVEAGQYAVAAELLGPAPENDTTLPGMGYVTGLTYAWYRADPEAAMAWSNSLPRSTKEAPTAGRINAISAISTLLALSDPAKAERYVATFQEPTDIMTASQGLISGYATRGDRPAAYRWLTEHVRENEPAMQASGPYDSALNEFFLTTRFLGAETVDPSGEIALIGKMRSAPLRDSAAWGYAARIQERDPRKAVEAVLVYAAQNRRETYLNAIVTTLAKRDPSSAVNLVAEMTSVTEDVRARLRVAATSVTP